MTWFSVDIESDGPVPGPYSMLSIGIVAINTRLVDGNPDTFYAELAPLQGASYVPEALAVSGLDRDKLASEGELPGDAMARCHDWVLDVNKSGRPVFIADNPAFDFAFANYYFQMYGPDANPFGWSARRIGDLWCGFKNDPHAPWKGMRAVEHTHNALDDAMANATALLAMRDVGLKMPVSKVSI